MSLLICTLLFGLAPEAPVHPILEPSAVEVSLQDPADEFERRFEAAGEDVEELWKVYSYCDSYGLGREGKKVLREIIKLDPDHKEARAASGHIYYDGEWFKSEKKLEAHKKEQLAKEAKAKGWVRYKDTWAHPDDIAKLQAGMVRDENGRWVSAEDHQRMKDGWVRHDLGWIPPEEVAEAEAGKFKCGDTWKSLEDANRYHSLPSRPWEIPSESGRFHIYTTVDRELALEAIKEAESTVRDLVRIFGKTPEVPMPFAVMKSSGQYGTFAAGDQAFGVPPTEVRGWSSIHGAYFGEVWFHGGMNLVGGGVAYWDKEDKNANRFGPFFTRHAAALSFVEALDPSPKAIAAFHKKKELNVEDFLKEKKLPDWMRYGAATYVERYRQDNTPGADAQALRKWSVSNILRTGSLDPVKRMIAMNLTVDDLDGSSKLLNESGLLVAFMLDGENTGVKTKHAAFKAAFASGDDFTDQLAELEKALEAAGDDLKAFADA